MLAEQKQSILDGNVKKRAVLYARTSSNDRAVDSLPSQLEICEQYASEEGYTIVDRLREDIKGVSGGDRNAPALNKALEMAQAGLYDVLIIRDVKRYSRDVYKSMDFESRFFDCGIDIEYVWNKELNGLPRRGTGFVMRFLQYWLAEEDRQHIVKKLYSKRVEKITRNHSVMTHGNPPYGYDETIILEGHTKRRILIINEGEAHWVRKIFEWYVNDGLSLRALARKLTENKVLKPSASKESKQNMGNNKRGPFEWNYASIKEILTRKAYMGEWEYAKNAYRRAKRKNTSIIADDLLDKAVSCPVPAIVSEELWVAAQNRLAHNSKKQRRTPKYDYLVRNRGRCKVCGAHVHPITRNFTRKKGEVRYYYYRCYDAHRSVTDCKLGQFKRDIIDTTVWQWLVGLMNDDEELRKGFEDYQNDTINNTQPLKAELSRIENNLNTHEDKLKKQAQAIAVLNEIGSTHAVDALKADILQIEKMIDVYITEKARVKAELKAMDKTGKIENFEKFVTEIRGRIERAQDNFKAQRAIIEALDVTVDFILIDGKKAFRPKCVVRDSQEDFIVYTSSNGQSSDLSSTKRYWAG